MGKIAFDFMSSMIGLVSGKIVTRNVEILVIIVGLRETGN
jgi:hypothetical protein